MGLEREAEEAAERCEAQVEGMRTDCGSSSWACRRVTREACETGEGGRGVGGGLRRVGLGFQGFCESF